MSHHTRATAAIRRRRRASSPPVLLRDALSDYLRDALSDYLRDALRRAKDAETRRWLGRLLRSGRAVGEMIPPVGQGEGKDRGAE